MKIIDVIIIGAGASGLMTALKALENGKKVVVLEGNSKIGKKLLATGNGRCNLTNENMELKYFHGETNCLETILQKYNTAVIKDEFQKLGILTVSDDEGRVYPKSLQASVVVENICDAIKERNGQIITDFVVSKIQNQKSLFTVFSEDGKSYTAKNLVISVGSKASPKHSCKAENLELIKSLGHSVEESFPVLTKFDCKDKILKSLSGVRAKCKASLENIYSEVGEMIFSDKTLSGICLFNLSNYANECFKKREKLKITFDFVPDMSEKELVSQLKTIIKFRPNMKSESLLSGIINSKLAIACMRKLGISKNVSLLSEKEIMSIVSLIKNFSFEVTRHNNWDNAQVSSGGVRLSEVNADTLESKFCKSLYFTGEVLNIHGDCGGYNLHWAWVSGIIVGERV